MKTRFILIVFAVFGISGLSHSQGLELYNWRPIKEITAQEICVIEDASHKKAADVVGRSTFVAVSRQTVMLWGPDGVLKLYAAGNKVAEKVSVEEGDQDSDPICRVCRDLENLFVEFSTIWHADDFKAADRFVLGYSEKLGQALKTNPNFLLEHDKHCPAVSDLSAIMGRGNRYFEIVEQFIPFFGPDQAIVLYEWYLEHFKALKSDEPSRENLISVLDKIGVMSELVESIFLSGGVFQLARTLTPELFKKLDAKQGPRN